jgi:hypothetical protein
LLECWRVLPSVPDEVCEGTLRAILQPNDFARLHNAWLAVSAFAKAQSVGSLPLIEAFHQSGIHYCLLKGAAAGYRLYPQPYMRTSWDFDLCVSRNDLEAAERLALRFGYRAAQRNADQNGFEAADPKLRAAVEAQHYELGFLVRRLQVTNLTPATLGAIRAVREQPWTHQFWEDVHESAPWCYSIVDIHHALSLDIGVEDLLSTARTMRTSNVQLRVPDDAWLAAHLIFKIYWEGVHSYKKGLYQFADVVRLMPFLNSAVFESLISILERHGMIAAGHYVFRRLPAFGVELPDHILSFVQDTFLPPEGGDPVRLNDVGDMWARLWGQR